MEETYGDNWAEPPADIYLPASDCTLGSYSYTFQHLGEQKIDKKIGLLY
jgi:hypothetical protein